MTTFTLKVPDLLDLCRDHLQTPGTAGTFSRGLVRSHYWGPTSSLLCFTHSRIPSPFPPREPVACGSCRLGHGLLFPPSPSLVPRLGVPPGGFSEGRVVGLQPCSVEGLKGLSVLVCYGSFALRRSRLKSHPLHYDERHR